MFKPGEIVRINDVLIYKDTRIEVSTKAKVFAVGANESFVLLEDINTGKLKNIYVENSMITVVEEEFSILEEELIC